MTDFLLMDIGNSLVKFARAARSSIRLIETTPHSKMLLAISQVVKTHGRHVPWAISSVVPELGAEACIRIEKMTGIKPVEADPYDTHVPVRVNYARGELGPDRYCAAVGAVWKTGAPVITVDMGTATTFGVVDESRVFCGGAICAGLGIQAKALARAGKRLGSVTLRATAKATGRSTQSAMNRGLVSGHRAMVDGMVESMSAEAGFRHYSVVLTGGYAGTVYGRRLLSERKDWHLRPMLVLKGLSVIARHYTKLHG